jgi:16S rRNA processing protein RimM
MKSPQPEFVTVGKILAPWGIKGKLKVEPITDFPERFAPQATVYVKHQPMTIDGTEWHKGKIVIKLRTIDSIEQAEKLRGQRVEIPRSQLRPLPEGQYYHFQIIGLKVWTTQSELLGTITEILSSESNDNYVVSGAKGEILIPAIEGVVKSIDLDTERMLIEPIASLLSLNKEAPG